jgi:hypothetical protein
MKIVYRRLTFSCIAFILISYSAYSSSANLVEIPISFDNANLPIVEMTIDTHRFKFYLDMGAKGLHLPEETLGIIDGAHLTGRTISSIDLAGNVREDAEFIIPELQINGLTFHNVNGQSLSNWGVGESEFSLPVVGIDVLRQKDFIIDFPRKRLLISDTPIDFGTLYPSTKDLRFEDIDEGLAVSVYVGENEWPFVLDSAASISIINASADIEEELITPCALDLPWGPCEKVSAHIDCGSRNFVLDLILMPLPDQFKPMGVIGYDFFSQCALCISKDNDSMKIAW